MGFLFKICFWFMVVVLIWHFLTKKYLNPYKLTMIFGKKGSGKSTLMVRMAYEYLAAGWTVFCTERLDGCIHIDYNDIGFKQIPPQSLLLIDEVGMIWDNRFMAEQENADGATLTYTTFKKVSGGEILPGMLIREISGKK